MVLLGADSHVVRATRRVVEGARMTRAVAGHICIGHWVILLGADPHVVPAARRIAVGTLTTGEGEAYQEGGAQCGQGGCQCCLHDVGILSVIVIKAALTGFPASCTEYAAGGHGV